MKKTVYFVPILVIMMSLICQATFAASDILSINVAKNTLVGTELQQVNVTITKPGTESLVDAELTIEISGFAYFSETNSKKITETYPLVDKDMTKTYTVKLEQGGTGASSDITISGNLKYFTQGKKFKYFGDMVRSVDPLYATSSASFTGVWTDVAPVQDELTECKTQLTSCNNEKIGLSNSITQRNTQLSELTNSCNKLSADNSGLRNYKLLFWPGIIVAFAVGWLVAKKTQ